MNELNIMPQPEKNREPAVRGTVERERDSDPQDREEESRLLEEVAEEAKEVDALLSEEKKRKLEMQALDMAGSLSRAKEAGVPVEAHDVYTKALQDLAVAKAELPIARKVMNQLKGRGLERIKRLIWSSRDFDESRAHLQEIEQRLHVAREEVKRLQNQYPVLREIIEQEQEEHEAKLQKEFEEAA